MSEETLDRIIESDTFTPTGETLGCGCWGSVDVYEDQGDQEWAIKVFSPDETAQQQMRERGWTEEDVMRREAIPLDAAAYNVVPRLIERDRKGTMYVSMPVFREGDLTRNMAFLSVEQSLQVARDIACALKYIHNSEAHGDVKPSNILVKDGRYFLGDLGSTTCISIGGSGSERGPHGDINYRAPECSRQAATPSERADVWSLGSILYESICGSGIYQGVDREVNEKSLQRQIDGKIRKLRVPRKLKSFLKRSLTVCEYNRLKNGEEALTELEGIIEGLSTDKEIRKHVKKWTLPLAVAAVAAGAISLGSLSEPKNLTIPKTALYGQIYLDRSPDEEAIRFDIENIGDLPSVDPKLIIDDSSIRRVTNSRHTAALLKSYFQTSKTFGYLKRGIYNEVQANMYIAYSSPDEKRDFIHRHFKIPARAIEVALSKAKNPDGSVDLEDTLAIARLGETKVSEAKKAAGSFDFRDYLVAKSPGGRYIIPKEEQRFLRTWLSYTHELFE